MNTRYPWSTPFASDDQFMYTVKTSDNYLTGSLATYFELAPDRISLNSEIRLIPSSAEMPGKILMYLNGNSNVYDPGAQSFDEYIFQF